MSSSEIKELIVKKFSNTTVKEWKRLRKFKNDEGLWCREFEHASLGKVEVVEDSHGQWTLKEVNENQGNENQSTHSKGNSQENKISPMKDYEFAVYRQPNDAVWMCEFWHKDHALNGEGTDDECMFFDDLMGNVEDITELMVMECPHFTIENENVMEVMQELVNRGAVINDSNFDLQDWELGSVGWRAQTKIQRATKPKRWDAVRWMEWVMKESQGTLTSQDQQEALERVQSAPDMTLKGYLALKHGMILSNILQQEIQRRAADSSQKIQGQDNSVARRLGLH